MGRETDILKKSVSGFWPLVFAALCAPCMGKDKPMEKDGWKFDQPPNCAVITTKDILNKKKDINYIYHDSDDEGWQFLDDGETDEERASVVALSTIVALDSTVKEVAEMKPGYHAYRKNKSEKWKVMKTD